LIEPAHVPPRVVEISEFAQRLRASCVRRRARCNQLLGAGVEVKSDLVFDIVSRAS
jgi:hypothetical protein